MSCKHCSDGCIHLVRREIPGIRHDNGFMTWIDPPQRVTECDIHPEKYHNWMETFGLVPKNMLTDKDYECFKDCYEPDEMTKSLDEMINLAKDILNTVKR